MSHYKPYPGYRPSGVEWIGDVPKHWTIVRAKNIISTSQNGVWGLDPVGDGTDTLCIRVADFNRGGLTVIDAPQTYRNISESDRFTRLVKKGDLLLEKSGGGEKTLVGAMVQYKGDKQAVCSNFVAVVRLSDGASSDWANYLFSAMYSVRINYKSIKQATGIQNLDAESYFDERVALPTFHEQIDIANCIDRETTRIDALITKKTRFIELLKEKRQALITHAVTKGLDPNVKMRDSGVEWIGEVPESWSFQPIKFHATIGNGSTPTKDNENYWENGHFPWLTSSCVNQEIVTCADQFVTDTALRECHLPVISPPAVLVGITGQGKTRGMAATLVIEATINQHIAFLKPKSQKLLVDYLRMFIDASYGWLRLESEAVGSTKGAITCEQLGNTKMPVPQIVEQQHILDQVRHKLSRMDRISEQTQRSIDLLKERRSAFITAAVTGQIDLRESV